MLEVQRRAGMTAVGIIHGRLRVTQPDQGEIMKRSVSLQALSRDHHQALVYARQCRQAGEEGQVAAIADVRAALPGWLEDHLAPHFTCEEQALLPLLAEAGEQELVERVLDEHARLLELAARISRLGQADDLLRFGELLESHVRFEERTVFDIAQTKLDALRLAERLASHCPDS